MGLNEFGVVDDIKPAFHVMEPSGMFMLLVSSPMTLLKKWRDDQYLHQAAYRVDTSEITALRPAFTVKDAKLLKGLGHTLYFSFRHVFLLLDQGVLATFDLDENRKELGADVAAAVAVERLFHIVLLLGAVGYFIYTSLFRNHARLVRP